MVCIVIYQYSNIAIQRLKRSTMHVRWYDGYKATSLMWVNEHCNQHHHHMWSIRVRALHLHCNPCIESWCWMGATGGCRWMESWWTQTAHTWRYVKRMKDEVRYSNEPIHCHLIEVIFGYYIPTYLPTFVFPRFGKHQRYLYENKTNGHVLVWCRI